MASHSSVLAWRIRDGGAWWAAVCGVTQSRTQLKRLSSSSSSRGERVQYVQIGASQVVLVVRNLPANAGDVRTAGSISGREDPMEEGMATHFSILAWRIP